MSSWQPKKRERVKAKTNGCCAYCGCVLGEKFHVDHVRSKHSHRQHGQTGWDDFENLVAACSPCNLYKSDLSLEDFREKINKAHERLLQHAGYRALLRYGAGQVEVPYTFFFETVDNG